MQMIPSHISKFIRRHHVVGFAAHSKSDFWAANCFYAFDEANARLIILTAQKTRHAQIMAENPQIVGTVCAQIEVFSEIEGVQFSAIARRLNEKSARSEALQIYYKRHPLARLRSSDVWELRLESLKHTGNKVIFAQKTFWRRENPGPESEHEIA